MSPKCLIRKDPPGEKFSGQSIISLPNNRSPVDEPSEEPDEESFITCDYMPDAVSSSGSAPNLLQPSPSSLSKLQLVQGRSTSKFDPSVTEQSVTERSRHDNDEPIDESSRTSDPDVGLTVSNSEASSDVPMSMLDPFIVLSPETLLDASVLSQPKNDEDSKSQEESTLKIIALVESIDVSSTRNDQDNLTMLNQGTTKEDTTTSALDLPSSKHDEPFVVSSPAVLDSSVVSQPKGDESINQPESSSNSNSIAWVAPIDYPSDINDHPFTIYNETAFVGPVCKVGETNPEKWIFNENESRSTLLVSESDKALIQPPRPLLDPSVLSHYNTYESKLDPSIVNARDASFIAANEYVAIEASSLDESPPTLLDPSVFSHYNTYESNLDPSITNERDSSFIAANEFVAPDASSFNESPSALLDPSFLSQTNYDSPVFYQTSDYDQGDVVNQPVTSSSIPSSSTNSNCVGTGVFPQISEGKIVKGSVRSSLSDLSGSIRGSGAFRASEYFERTIIEEYNLRIEEEQQNCSLVSMPVVAAVYDDASTILVRPPPTAVMNPDNNRRNGVIPWQTSRKPDVPQAPCPPPRKALAVQQLKKLRQEHGLPTGVVLEMGEFQKIACSFFVFDTHEIESGFIKECAKLAEAVSTQTIFCFGSYQQEILYPPAKMVNGKVPRSADVLDHCVAAIPTSGRYTTTRETTIKLMEIAKRIPSFDTWPTENVAVTIVTDRTFQIDQDDDKDFIDVIRSLKKLGARVVIRLTTSNRQVVSYYKFLRQTFSSVSVLHSFEYQMKLVHHFNPWLNYGAPFHRARELGFNFHRTVEALSQELLDKDQMREFFVVFHGKKVMVLAPDVYSEWFDFFAYLKKINQREGKHRLGLDAKNKNRRDFWIDLTHFERIFRSEHAEPSRTRRSTNMQRGNYSQFLRVEI